MLRNPFYPTKQRAIKFYLLIIIIILISVIILILGTFTETNITYYQLRLLVDELDKENYVRQYRYHDYIEFICNICVSVFNALTIVMTFICFLYVLFIFCTKRRGLSNKYFRKFILRHVVLIFLFLSRYATNLIL